MHSPTNANHTRHDSHHHFSVHARDFQPRSPSPLKHYHHEVSPSHSTRSDQPTTHQDQHNISPITPIPFPSPMLATHPATLTPTHRTILARWSRTEQKFTSPCLKCAEDGYIVSACTHSMIECSAVPDYHRAKLRKDREELHVGFLGLLNAKREAPVFAALEAIVKVLPDVAKDEWIREGRVGIGATEEALAVLGRRYEGWGWMNGEDRRAGRKEVWCEESGDKALC